MRRYPLLAAAALLLASQASAAEPRTLLYDVSADSLEAGQSEWGLLFARYSRGIVPGLQLSTHLAGDAIALVNLSAKYQFLDLEDARASLEAGVVWWPVLALSNQEGINRLLSVPLDLRATLPLWGELEVTAGLHAGLTIAPRVAEIASESPSPVVSSFGASLAWAHYDRRGAWLLTLGMPLVRRVDSARSSFLGRVGRGTVVFDDVGAWSAMISRDHVFGKGTHVRAGLGYRNHPGLVVLDSYGKLMIDLGLYWR